MPCGHNPPFRDNAMLINFPLIPYSCSECAFAPCGGEVAVGELRWRPRPACMHSLANEAPRLVLLNPHDNVVY